MFINLIKNKEGEINEEINIFIDWNFVSWKYGC